MNFNLIKYYIEFGEIPLPLSLSQTWILFGSLKPFGSSNSPKLSKLTAVKRRWKADNINSEGRNESAVLSKSLVLKELLVEIGMAKAMRTSTTLKEVFWKEFKMTMGWMLLERRALAILIKGGRSNLFGCESVRKWNRILFYLNIPFFFNWYINIPNYHFINIYKFIKKGSQEMHATNLYHRN